MLHCLYSASSMDREELPVIRKTLGEQNVSDLLTDISPGSLVIPRYRAIPYGDELERDIHALGSSLLNTYQQHRNIAEMHTWIGLLEGLTPPAYDIEDIPRLPEGEYFVKGETNSLKNNWFSSSYAPTKRELVDVVHKVQSDHYVGHQRVIVRPFQQYRQIGKAVDGRPIFHERRAFILDGEVLTDAFYWSSHAEELGDIETLNPQAYKDTLTEAVKRTLHLARFIVIDLAEYPDGSWGVVELNDGVMSGLSENPPHVLWEALRERLSASGARSDMESRLERRRQMSEKGIHAEEISLSWEEPVKIT